MTIDPTTPRSRRKLLTTGAGAIAGLAAVLLGRPAPVRADDGTALILGVYNQADTRTDLDGSFYLTGDFIAGGHGGTDVAVSGTGGGSNGMGGYFTTYNAHGVKGEALTGGEAVISPPPPWSSGVYGKNIGGRGVFGEATSGIGVDALATSGIGLQAVSTGGSGIRARSMSGTPVDAFSSTGTGVFGWSSASYGVHGFAGGSLAGVLGVGNRGPGVQGSGQQGVGVLGTSETNAGVKGASDEGTAVYGAAGPPAGTPPSPRYTGVFGYGGTSGVHGRADLPGSVALRGEAAGDATALQTSGPVNFGLASGSARIALRSRTRVVTPGVPLTIESRILCSLESEQADLSIHRIVTDLISTPPSFTVHLSASLRARGSRIHWFVIG